MSNPKDIVVYVDSGDTAICKQQIDYAFNVAREWDSHVIVAHAPEEMTANIHRGFARGSAISGMIAAYEARITEFEEWLRKCLNESTQAYGVTSELRICHGEQGEALMLHARHASLAMLGRGQSVERADSALTRTEDVIFASGRPTIILPKDWPIGQGLPKVIVIGWNASREATRAIADAMPFLRAADKVHIVVVPEPKVNKILSEDPGADIARHLARNGVNVVLDCIQGSDAGEVIATRAKELGADMIVMGAFGQSLLTEFVFGSATSTLLAGPPIPIHFSS